MFAVAVRWPIRIKLLRGAAERCVYQASMGVAPSPTEDGKALAASGC